jgi:hypothetical protein
MDDIEQITKQTVHGIFQERYPNIVSFIQNAINQGYSWNRIAMLLRDMFRTNQSVLNNMLLELDYLWESRQKSKELLFGKDE